MDPETHEKFLKMREAVTSHFDALRKDIKPSGIFDLKSRATLGRLTTLQRQLETELYDILESDGDVSSLIAKYQEEENEIIKGHSLMDDVMNALEGKNDI